MHSDLIGKIEKARRYAEERDRVVIDEMRVRFHGGNHDHAVRLDGEPWTCDCTVFRLRGTCAHIMTMQKILEPMLSAQAREMVALTMHSDLISMVEKSRHYAHEPERITIEEIKARFRGSNNAHCLTLAENSWSCDCESFRIWRTCAHVMAMQKIFAAMLTPAALQPASAISEEQMAGTLS
jgi:hypothetical protein